MLILGLPRRAQDSAPSLAFPEVCRELEYDILLPSQLLIAILGSIGCLPANSDACASTGQGGAGAGAGQGDIGGPAQGHTVGQGGPGAEAGVLGCV